MKVDLKGIIRFTIFLMIFMLLHPMLPGKGRVMAATSPIFYIDAERTTQDCLIKKANIDFLLSSGENFNSATNYYLIDFTNMDGFQMTYKNWVEYCGCSNTAPFRQCRITYSVGGKFLIQLSETKRAKSIDDIPFSFCQYSDISAKTFEAGDQTSFSCFASKDKCSYCGTPCHSATIVKDVYLYDYRGICTSINSAEVLPGKSVVIAPRFNDYTKNVVYKIKYAGENSYQPLIVGTERNGMNVSVGADYSINLTNVNASKGNFDILPLPYDRSGSLPYGFDENTDSHVAHITLLDVEAPVISRLPNVYDRVNGTVTVEFNATDNFPLPANCYSFDSGAYSSVKAQKYNKAGVHKITVKDGAGNTSEVEYSISEEDVLKNDTEKPVITKLANVYDRENGTVTVEFLASDNRPLPDNCYSFDSGAYSDVRKQKYSQPGTHKITVRDAAGNTAFKEYVITKADVAKTSGKGEDDNNTPETPGSPSSPSTPQNPYPGDPVKPTEPTNPGPNPGGDDDNPPGGSSSSSRVPGGPINSSTTVRKNIDVTIPGISSSTASTITGKKIINSNLSEGSSTDKKVKSLSESQKNTLFDNIKNNSGKYVVNQDKEASKYEGAEKTVKSDIAVNEDASEKEIENSYGNIEMDEELLAGAESLDGFRPEKKKSGGFYLLFLSLALILVILMIFFALFFMVALFVETDTEILGERKKKLIGIRVIFVNKKYWSLNMNDLLNKYPTIFAYPGLLFVYMFQGEYMKILSKVHGDEKREIAREEIKRQMVIGKARGRRK